MSRMFFSVVSVLLAPLSDLGAQVTPSINAGDQVRVIAPSIRQALIGAPWIRGSVVSLDADTLVLMKSTRTTLAIPLTSVTKFEVKSKSTGRWEEMPLPAPERHVELGDRVRVQAPPYRGRLKALGGPWIGGSVAALDADTLLLKTGGRWISRGGGPARTRGRVYEPSDSLAIPLDSVRKFEVSRRRTRASEGFLIGVGIGVIIGTLSAASFEEEEDSSDFSAFGCMIMCTRSEAFVYPLVFLGMPLAALGAAVGAATPSERWEEVPLPLHVGFSPHGGVRVALHYEFGK